MKESGQATAEDRLLTFALRISKCGSYWLNLAISASLREKTEHQTYIIHFPIISIQELHSKFKQDPSSSPFLNCCIFILVKHTIALQALIEFKA